MMKYALLLAVPLFFWGCRKDPSLVNNGELKLTVRATWNGQPFDKSVTYPNALDQRVKVSQLKFYLADMHLHGNGSATVFDAALFDVTDGPITHSYTVAAASYDSISLGLGLPQALNHAEPVLYPVTHPLGAASGMLWNWTETFHRFVIFDGRFDTDPNATGLPPFQFSLHTGRDECYRTKGLSRSVRLVQDGTTELTLNIDVAEFFRNTAGTLQFDLTQGSQSHGAVTELPQALRLSDMMIDAIHVAE